MKKPWIEGEPEECDGSAWDRLPPAVRADQKEACPLCRGAGFVTYRDGIAYETHDVEREEHLIEDCPECTTRHNLPFHEETMADLKALTIRAHGPIWPAKRNTEGDRP